MRLLVKINTPETNKIEKTSGNNNARKLTLMPDINDAIPTKMCVAGYILEGSVSQDEVFYPPYVAYHITPPIGVVSKFIGDKQDKAKIYQ